MKSVETRIEKDSMGEMAVPKDALYGASTQRAVLNFPVSGYRFSRAFIRALGLIKWGAAQANHDLGLLDAHRAALIVQAAEEVIEGKLDQHFPLDIFQTGSGTSTNTNANEVIANRCAQLAGKPIGSREPVHPNDHVNMGQSSNDVIPSAIHLSAAEQLQDCLLPALEKLRSALSGKAKEFHHIIKIGNDVRWLGSGPRCGIGEIRLPATQPGSSIMPGKVNPVLCESMMMVCAQVFGNDAVVTWAGANGNFELNVMMPVMAHNILESIRLLGNVADAFTEKCVVGIEANEERCRELVELSMAMVTSLAPKIGYDRAAEIAKESARTGKTVRELCQEKKILPEKELNAALDPAGMTEPGGTGSAGG